MYVYISDIFQIPFQQLHVQRYIIEEIRQKKWDVGSNKTMVVKKQSNHDHLKSFIAYNQKRLLLRFFFFPKTYN